MITLAMTFRSEGKDEWFAVSNKGMLDYQDVSKRVTSADDVYVLESDSSKAEVFRTMEDVLAVQAHIVRVINRRHENGEEFDVDFEHTGAIAKKVWEILKKNRNTAISFKYFELKPEAMGEIAFSIRSDVRF